jgi:hypothetical protein
MKHYIFKHRYMSAVTLDIFAEDNNEAWAAVTEITKSRENWVLQTTFSDADAPNFLRKQAF